MSRGSMQTRHVRDLSSLGAWYLCDVLKPVHHGDQGDTKLHYLHRKWTLTPVLLILGALERLLGSIPRVSDPAGLGEAQRLHF